MQIIWEYFDELIKYNSFSLIYHPYKEPAIIIQYMMYDLLSSSTVIYF